MIPSPVHSRQPLRQPWTRERLFRERAIALGQAIDNSTWKNYGSALNSYLNFVKIHDFPLEPRIYQQQHTPQKGNGDTVSQNTAGNDTPSAITDLPGSLTT